MFVLSGLVISSALAAIVVLNELEYGVRRPRLAGRITVLFDICRIDSPTAVNRRKLPDITGSDPRWSCSRLTAKGSAT